MAASRLSSHPSRSREGAHDDGGGRRVDVDHVDGAVAIVRQVVVEHDQFARGRARTSPSSPRRPSEPQSKVIITSGAAGNSSGGVGDVEAGQVLVVRGDDERRRPACDRRFADRAAEVVHARASNRARRRRARCDTPARRIRPPRWRPRLASRSLSTVSLGAHVLQDLLDTPARVHRRVALEPEQRRALHTYFFANDPLNACSRLLERLAPRPPGSWRRGWRRRPRHGADRGRRARR